MPIRRHLSGLGQDISTGTGHTYHQDEQGSTAYVTGTTGEAENLYSYGGFGNILEKKEDIANRILYTGQQYDQEMGQYYLRARYYNPVIGRFTQEDTYRGDGLNLYAYCGNNPVMYYDPSGHGMLDSIGVALTGCPVQTNASQKNTQAEKVNSEGGRNSKGTVVGGLDYNPSEMMRGSHGNIGVIPDEIASQLNGRTYNDFDEFRNDFWKAVSNSSYANEFSESNISRMSKGLAPKAHSSQQYGELSSYILHHKTPIQHGGEVYNLDNIIIVTPRMHQEILDKSYHFG